MAGPYATNDRQAMEDVSWEEAKSVAGVAARSGDRSSPSVTAGTAGLEARDT